VAHAYLSLPCPALPCLDSWDIGRPALIRYAFKDAPDAHVLPPEPEPDEEAEELGEGELKQWYPAPQRRW